MGRLILSAMVAVMLFAAVPPPAGAFEPYQGACKGKNEASAACKAKGSSDPLTGDDGILLKATNIIAYLAGAIAVIMIIVGSIRFLTSGTDVSTGSRTDTDVEDARRTIISALVGLAVIVLAKAIITYVVKRL